MTPTRATVRAVIDRYIRAWVEQNPDLLDTIFTASATYHERAFDDPIRTRDGIRAYWQRKVVESQANIDCRLVNLYLDGGTAVAEWEARFDDLSDGFRKRMREVAILEFEADRIASLREYWTSEQIGRVDASGRR